MPIEREGSADFDLNQEKSIDFNSATKTIEEDPANMTKEEREIREYYRLHAEISGVNPYNHLLASNGGPGTEKA